MFSWLGAQPESVRQCNLLLLAYYEESGQQNMTDKFFYRNGVGLG